MNHDLIDFDRLLAAYERVRLDLLQERNSAGHWVGELATSALSTATAVSALSLFDRRLTAAAVQPDPASQLRQKLIIRGIEWLADHQNEDGGWGDTDQSYSNIATTMLAVAAFHLTGVPADHADLLSRADLYIKRAGGVPGLRRRYGKDKTFAVPILTNCALAGMVSWREVSPLPFELACFPQSMYRRLQLPVVSYAIPALVAIGQCRYYHRKPLNPVTRVVRGLAAKHSLEVLRRIQPASGGYLEAIPLTSFVVMSLVSIGQAEHDVARKGVDFLIQSVRSDGSWPIDSNLSTWNTTLAMNALANAGESVSENANLDWLLSCQWTERHPYTGADPGGWGWSDLSGAVPDADDTPGALLALAACRREVDSAAQSRIDHAARQGIRWLLDLQNSDGGWPTFCRGWGKLPFDRSGPDLTAHAVRAVAAWQTVLPEFQSEYPAAIQAGIDYLRQTQQPDGSWFPLWFGNQDHPDEQNPTYGTARVLLAYLDLAQTESIEAQRGMRWLVENQRADGGWCGMPVNRDATRGEVRQTGRSTVEETALAVDALARFPVVEAEVVARGAEWLVAAIEAGCHRQPAPIGFYFSKLWYYEKLYPFVFALSALGQVLHRATPLTQRTPESPQLAC